MAIMRLPQQDNVGRLDTPFEIWRTSDDSDDGWSNTQEELFLKGYAEMIELKSRDYQFAVSTGTSDQIKLRIRRRPGIRNDMTVQLNGERYSIISKIGESSRKPYMNLIIERRTL